MTQFKVTIEHYRPVDKGSLKGYFTAVIENPPMKITDCREFVKDGQSWYKGPEKKIEGKNGSEDKYFPYIFFTDRNYKISLDTAILHALKEYHGKAKSGNQERQKSSLPSETPVEWL